MAHYVGYLFWFDLSFVIIQSIAMNSSSFEISYFKLFIFLKFIRLLQIDKFYLRRLSLHKVFKVTYVIFKQMVIIYLASHIVGIIFYIIDYYFVNTPVCEGANQECTPLINYSLLALQCHCVLSHNRAQLQPPILLHNLLRNQHNQHDQLRRHPIQKSMVTDLLNPHHAF